MDDHPTRIRPSRVSPMGWNERAFLAGEPVDEVDVEGIWITACKDAGIKIDTEHIVFEWREVPDTDYCGPIVAIACIIGASWIVGAFAYYVLAKWQG